MASSESPRTIVRSIGPPDRGRPARRGAGGRDATDDGQDAEPAFRRRLTTSPAPPPARTRPPIAASPSTSAPVSGSGVPYSVGSAGSVGPPWSVAGTTTSRVAVVVGPSSSVDPAAEKVKVAPVLVAVTAASGAWLAGFPPGFPPVSPPGPPPEPELSRNSLHPKVRPWTTTSAPGW